eukprot:jgi/Mesvir1/26946/Mv20667-RA.1
MARALQRLPSQLRSAMNPIVRTATRSMSGAAGIEEEVAEMNKWKKITGGAVVLCGVLTVYTLANTEHVHKDKTYPYMRLRNKTFPWGDCGLFENCDGEHAGHH